MSISIRLMRGQPSAEDLAALAAVLLTREAAGSPARAARSQWSDRAGNLRQPFWPSGTVHGRRWSRPHA